MVALSKYTNVITKKVKTYSLISLSFNFLSPVSLCQKYLENQKEDYNQVS